MNPALTLPAVSPAVSAGLPAAQAAPPPTPEPEHWTDQFDPQSVARWVVAVVLAAAVGLGHWLFGDALGFWVAIPWLVPLAFVAYAAGLFREHGRVICRIGGMGLTYDSFCKGILVTGDIGSGKSCALQRIFHSLYQNCPEWGGMVVDEKGSQHEDIAEIDAHYAARPDYYRPWGEGPKFIVCRTRYPSDPPTWNPEVRINLIGDKRVPSNVSAAAVVATYTSVSGGTKDSNPFFPNQVRIQVAKGIDLLWVLVGLRMSFFEGPEELPLTAPTLPLVKKLLVEGTRTEGPLPDILRRILQRFGVSSDKPTQAEVLARCGNEIGDLVAHFEWAYLAQDVATLANIRSSITVHLEAFCRPEVQEVFCSPSPTFSFDEMNRGRVVCVSTHQGLATERKFICALMKELFYSQARRRFELPKRIRREMPLCVLVQDEAQRFLLEADGDVDILRASRCTTILAMQMQPAAFVQMDKQKAEVLMANLKTRIVFRSAFEDCAAMSSKFFGKRKFMKRTVSRGRGGTSVSLTPDEEPRIPARVLQDLRQFECVIRHPSGKLRKVMLRPVDGAGKKIAWWKLDR